MRLGQLQITWTPAAPWDLAAEARRLAQASRKFLRRAEIELSLGAVLWTTLIFLIVRSGE